MREINWEKEKDRKAPNPFFIAVGLYTAGLGLLAGGGLVMHFIDANRKEAELTQLKQSFTDIDGDRSTDEIEISEPDHAPKGP